MSEKRGNFGSRFGTIAVIAGSAIGLGNIWKFPYVAGENGGAAFIIIYILISFLISVPVMLSEFSIGRASRRNVLGAFKVITPQRGWRGLGYLGILSSFVILSFYSVIAGWTLEFLKESFTNSFAGHDSSQITSSFNLFVASGWKPVFWSLVFLIINCVVVASGVNKGIERYSKILMPLLAFILISMAIGSMFLSGFADSVRFMFKPDFSKITANVLLQALGQSFFSMSIGMGAMITYGSYVKSSENMYKLAGTVAIADVVVAIFAGLAIFPAVFTYGINPTSGPDLVFLTLPTLFGQIPGGYIISIVFFFLLLFAAITSSFSMIEVIVAYISEEFKTSRVKANVVTFFTVGIMTSLCAISQMPDSKLRVAGKNLFDLFDTVSSNYMLPIGGLAIVIFVGWFMDKKLRRREFTSNETFGVRFCNILIATIRYVVPVAMILMFLGLTGVL